jgi:hypothetical protein
MEELQDTLAPVLDIEAEGEEAILEQLAKAGLSKAALNAVKGMLRLGNAFKEEPGMADVLTKLTDLSGEQTETEKQDEEEKEEEEEEMSEAKKTGFDLEGVPEDIQNKLDEFWKSREEEVKKREEELVKKTQQLEKALAEERDVRIKKEMILKAEKEFGNLPGITAEDMGDLLLSLQKADKELCEKIEKVFSDASTAIGEGNLFKEAGNSSLGSGGDSWTALEKKAEIIKSKSGSGMTQEQALAKAMDENPDLYEAYLAENPRQSVGG